MNTVWIISAVMLAAAAVATMFRMLLGPTTLDRLVALDTLVAVTMCVIGTWAAFSLDTTVTYSLTALALITFAVAGSLRTLQYDYGIWATALLGVITAVGGGVIREQQTVSG